MALVAAADAAGGQCCFEVTMELAPTPKAFRVQCESQLKASSACVGDGPEAGGGPAPMQPPTAVGAKPAALPLRLPASAVPEASGGRLQLQLPATAIGAKPGIQSPHLAASFLACLSSEPFETVFSDQLGQAPSLSRTPSPDHLHGCRPSPVAARVDRSRLVRNLDTGAVRDIVDPRSGSQSFVGQPSAFAHAARPLPKPWRQWWRDKHQRDERLCLAAAEGDAATLRALLEPPPDGGAPTSPNVHDGSGRPALHLAAASGGAAVVGPLLAAGAALEERDATTASTALHLASRRGDLPTVRLLLEAGAQVAVEAADGCLPLHLAAVGGHPDVAELLLERGGAAQLQARNRFGQRPSEVSIDVRTAELFRRAGAAASRAGEDSYAGRTAFSGGVLLRNSRADAVRRLLGPRGAPGAAPASPPAAPSPSLASSSQGSPRHAPFVRMRSSSPEAEGVGPHSFELLELLGKGSFGEVYHARHKQTKQPYAMKVLRKFRIRSSNLLRYTLTERNILAYVRHPYIVSLHYAFQTPSHLVLVLQFCPRGNLQQLINREKRLPQALAKLYSAEILLALCHIHARCTIFRDLKPDNVVIDHERHALLTDFGLSKEGVKGLQGAKSFCGSLAFLAPEILLRHSHGHPVDIYNLGVLLFDMLTGRPPFFDSDPDQLFANIKRACLEVPKYVPEAARDLILATMVRDPSKRLGASQTAELKGHDFFKGLDFEAVLRREVPPPELGAVLPQAQRSPRQGPPRSPFDTPDLAAGALPRRPRSGGIEDGQTVTGWEFAAVR